jgi:ubiquinone/menaquinone biosynthesis C-methylase UbiE
LEEGEGILEIGGGRSGLAAMLYPGADVVSLDLDPAHASHQPAGGRTRFVCGDARALPFPDESFAVVTLFDVLEHIVEHEVAVAEALRVTRPGGHVLVSTPAADWHYPVYRPFRRHAPHESELMAEWGHVRRGYTVQQLAALFGSKPVATATFINPVTAFYHDVAFSRLGPRRRKLLYAAAAPLVLGAYALHRGSWRGTETALAWRK